MKNDFLFNMLSNTQPKKMLTKSIRPALAVAMALFLVACSSSATFVPEPINITGSYNGTFTSNSDNGTDQGAISLNIAQTIDAADVTGTYSAQGSSCLGNGTVSGTVNGFSVNLESDIGTGMAAGTLTFQLTSNNLGTLTGTYVVTGMACLTLPNSGSLEVSL